MLKRLYAWTLSLAEHPRALTALAILSFAESSVFPIPPDVLMLPMMFAQPGRSVLIATVATLTSVAGGLVGYAIGYFFFDLVGRPVLAFYGFGDALGAFDALFAEWGWWILIIGGFSPLPFKLKTIACGAAHLDLGLFVLASLLSRGSRFYLEAWIVRSFGPSMRLMIERRLGLVFTAISVVLLVGVVAAAYWS